MKLGKVVSITDTDRFYIKFSIEGEIQEAIAHPMDTFDEPNEGDPVVIFKLDGYESYLYKKLRLEPHTRMKLGTSLVDIYNDHIDIHANDGANIITINSDGSISIKSDNSISVESKEISIKGESKITLESSSDVTITGGGTLTVNGSVAPTGSGPFCGIPACLFTGAPHVDSKVTGI